MGALLSVVLDRRGVRAAQRLATRPLAGALLKGRTAPVTPQRASP